MMIVQEPGRDVVHGDDHHGDCGGQWHERRDDRGEAVEDDPDQVPAETVPLFFVRKVRVQDAAGVQRMLGHQQEEKRRHEEYAVVDHQDAWNHGVLSEECGSEGDEGQPEQEDVVQPEQTSVRAAEFVEEVMVVDPKDGQCEEAESEGDQTGGNGTEGVPDAREGGVIQVGDMEFQHKERNDDGDDRVAVDFHARGIANRGVGCSMEEFHAFSIASNYALIRNKNEYKK